MATTKPETAEPSYVRRALAHPSRAAVMAAARWPGRARTCSTECSTPRSPWVCAVIVAMLVWPTVKFLIVDAGWTGSSRVDCLPETLGRESAPAGRSSKPSSPIQYGFYPASGGVAVRISLMHRR